MKIKKVFLDADGNIVPDVSTFKAPPLGIKSEFRKENTILRTAKHRLTKEENGHWQFTEQLNANGKFGFIYFIRSLITNRCYIGCKRYVGTGVKNKGVESNWRIYTSSCKALCEEIKINGKENFEFIVLEEYAYRGTLTYAEVWSLMQVEALFHNTIWYNRLINKVSWVVKEKITQRHKDRLYEAINKLNANSNRA